MLSEESMKKKTKTNRIDKGLAKVLEWVGDGPFKEEIECSPSNPDARINSLN